MHLSTRYLFTGLKILVKSRRNLLEGQHPILKKHMWGTLLFENFNASFLPSQLVTDSVEQIDDIIDDVSEDEAKEKDSDDVTKDSLIKPTTTKKAKAKKTKK